MIYDKLINHVDLIRCPLYHPVFPSSWSSPLKQVRFQTKKHNWKESTKIMDTFCFCVYWGKGGNTWIFVVLLLDTTVTTSLLVLFSGDIEY